MTGFSIGRSIPSMALLLLPTFAVVAACSSAETEAEVYSSASDAAATTDALISRYSVPREDGKSPREVSALHSAHRASRGLSPSYSDRPVYTEGQNAMESAVLLARFSTNDSYESERRKQAVEELQTRIRSRDLDAGRALDLLDQIAPEASINERREAATRLAELSRVDEEDWDDRNTVEAAEELARLITGNAVDSEKRIYAAKELARRSNNQDLDADSTFDLMNDIAPELSINERREAAGNLVRLSKSERWDAETSKQAAEESFRFITGGDLDIEKRGRAGVDLAGEGAKWAAGDSFSDRDIQNSSQLIKEAAFGDSESLQNAVNDMFGD